jgi:hypothetical protein
MELELLLALEWGQDLMSEFVWGVQVEVSNESVLWITLFPYFDGVSLHTTSR